MTKDEIAFIQKNEKACNFCGIAYFAYYIIMNAFITSHLIKLFKSCSTNVYIMKCTFIVQNNRYYLMSKIKHVKTERKSAGDFFSLSQVFNDINDN